MQRPSETNYHETLREVGNRAGAAVEEIYDDLQEHINVIRNISSDRRSALAKQVQSLYDVCRMPGSFFCGEWAIRTAIHKMKSGLGFFVGENLDLLPKTMDGVMQMI